MTLVFVSFRRIKYYTTFKRCYLYREKYIYTLPGLRYRVFFKHKNYRPVIRTDLLNFTRILYISLQNMEVCFHIFTDLSIQIIVLWDTTSCTVVPMYCNLLQAPFKRLYTSTRLYGTTPKKQLIFEIKVWYFKKTEVCSCILVFLCSCVHSEPVEWAVPFPLNSEWKSWEWKIPL